MDEYYAATGLQRHLRLGAVLLSLQLGKLVDFWNVTDLALCKAVKFWPSTCKSGSVSL